MPSSRRPSAAKASGRQAARVEGRPSGWTEGGNCRGRALLVKTSSCTCFAYTADTTADTPYCRPRWTSEFEPRAQAAGEGRDAWRRPRAAEKFLARGVKSTDDGGTWAQVSHSAVSSHGYSHAGSLSPAAAATVVVHTSTCDTMLRHARASEVDRGRRQGGGALW